jgi:hypothetical protein
LNFKKASSLVTDAENIGSVEEIELQNEILFLKQHGTLMLKQYFGSNPVRFSGPASPLRLKLMTLR